MSRSDDPTRTGDVLLIVLGIVLLILAALSAIGAFMFLRSTQGGVSPFRIGATVLLGGLSVAMAAAGWQLTRRYLKERLEEQDDYEGPRWPDVTVEEERRLRLEAGETRPS